MAVSNFATTNYASDQFVESCGALLFDFTSAKAKVCLVHYAKKDEWLLAKGRRNCNESRSNAALREVREETGYQGHLYPLAMPTRAPRADDAEDIIDQARTHSDLTEPFMVSIREITGKSNIKLIWWYIAEVDQSVPKGDGEGEFAARFFDCDEAVERLAYQGDRDILTRAISLIAASRDIDSVRPK